MSCPAVLKSGATSGHLFCRSGRRPASAYGKSIVIMCGILIGVALLGGCESLPDRRLGSSEYNAEPPVRRAATPARAQDIQLTPSHEESAHNTAAGVVEHGTGSFVQPASRPRASIAHDTGGDVSLNVADADVREVVRLVLDDTLHVNYVIDPAVSGSVTVHTSHPVRIADLPAMLDAILRVNGAAIVQVGDLYKIVPIEQALTSGPAADIHRVPEAGRPGFAVLVVPVHFVSATALATLLEPFAPPGGSLQADPERNLLLLGGIRDELSTLTDLVSMFDVDWLAGMSFGLYPLDFAPAAQLVTELQQIFALEAGHVGSMVRFVPIERLNAVLVISTQPAYLDRAEAWIHRLDQAGEDGEAQVFVYAVQNGRAADLAEVLGKIFNVQSTAVGPRDLLAPGLQPVSIGSSSTDGEKLENGDLAQSIPPEPAGQLTQSPSGRSGPEARNCRRRHDQLRLDTGDTGRVS